MNIDWQRLFLATDGRIGRAQFWIGLVAAAVVGVVLLLIIGVAFGATLLGETLVFICEVIIAYPVFCIMAKRLQDRGRPGIYSAAAVIVPLVTALLTLFGLTGTEAGANLFGEVLNFINLALSLWVLIDLGILPGTPGPNAFGPAPAM